MIDPEALALFVAWARKNPDVEPDSEVVPRVFDAYVEAVRRVREDVGSI